MHVRNHRFGISNHHVSIRNRDVGIDCKLGLESLSLRMLNQTN